MDIFIISIGNILAVCFKILICRNVGTQTVHYYFGSHNCYGTIWKLSFIGIILVIITNFVIIISKKYKFKWFTNYRFGFSNNNNINHRKTINLHNYYNNIILFKQNYELWELIILSRRITIALLTNLYTSSEP